MKIDEVPVKNPQSYNFIFGQSHFIKTVEDIHEAVVNSVPNVAFGLAFAEASGPRKIRTSGTDHELELLAAENAKAVGCGHTFFLFLKNAFPINVMRAVKEVPEVVTLFCATANPVTVLVARLEGSSAVLGVADGGTPSGIENLDEKHQRNSFLRQIGYKLE